MKPSVKYLVIYRHSEKYAISEMCRILGVSRSGYYDFVSRMDKPEKDAGIAKRVRECQELSRYTYGYRRVHIWLERNGIHRNPKKNHHRSYVSQRIVGGDLRVIVLLLYLLLKIVELRCGEKLAESDVQTVTDLLD